jgi:hypothetical protein
MGVPLGQASYQPMADLYLDLPTHTKVENYRRELDLTTGRILVTYDNQGTRYTRESFASCEDASAGWTRPRRHDVYAALCHGYYLLPQPNGHHDRPAPGQL